LTRAQAPTGRREQNKLEKRARIIAAARALFKHKGYDATTTQEIAEAAGVASGTIFTYASTKEDLVILVFHEEMLSVIQDATAKARAGTTLRDQLIAFFDVMVNYHERDLTLSRTLLRQLGYVSTGDQRALVSELMNALLGQLTLIVEAAKSRGEIVLAQPAFASARAAFAIYYFHLGGLMSGYINRTQFDQSLKTDLSLLMRGLE
jgi:AcrR family transcriptional regulator|tara:strand:- start:1902 stop:2519 length:618 start_codon:yes stop_codon:yes gene_type:complete